MVHGYHQNFLLPFLCVWMQYWGRNVALCKFWKPIKRMRWQIPVFYVKEMPSCPSPAYLEFFLNGGILMSQRSPVPRGIDLNGDGERRWGWSHRLDSFYHDSTGKYKQTYHEKATWFWKGPPHRKHILGALSPFNVQNGFIGLLGKITPLSI